MNKSLYTLQINTTAVCFEIRLNDLPVHTERRGKPVAAELPINHFLNAGMNTLSVTLSPSKNDNQYVPHSRSDFELFIRDADQKREERQSVSKIRYPDYIHDESLHFSTLPGSLKILAGVPFTQTWASCRKLTLDEQTVSQTYKIYLDYFMALRDKNIGKILELTAIKDTDFAKSYYMAVEDQKTRMKTSLLSVLSDPDYKLIEFDIQEKSLVLNADERLVSLMNIDKRSPLQFYNPVTSVTKSYPIFLGMVNNVLAVVF